MIIKKFWVAMSQNEMLAKRSVLKKSYYRQNNMKPFRQCNE